MDELLVEDEADDVVISPRRDQAAGANYCLLTRPDDPSGRAGAKIAHTRAQAASRNQDPSRGHDWFYVLTGIVRLRVGNREIFISAGKAASFDTMNPHTMDRHNGSVEILSVLDHHGERAHLHD